MSVRAPWVRILLPPPSNIPVTPSKQLDSSFEFDESNIKHNGIIWELTKEMLQQIPQYRHPTNDIVAETRIFIDPDCIQLKGKMHQKPEFLRVLKKESLPEPVIEMAEEYVKEAEIAKLDLRECRHALDGYKEKLERAYRKI